MTRLNVTSEAKRKRARLLFAELETSDGIDKQKIILLREYTDDILAQVTRNIIHRENLLAKWRSEGLI